MAGEEEEPGIGPTLDQSQQFDWERGFVDHARGALMLEVGDQAASLFIVVLPEGADNCDITAHPDCRLVPQMSQEVQRRFIDQTNEEQVFYKRDKNRAGKPDSDARAEDPLGDHVPVDNSVASATPVGAPDAVA